MPAIEILGLIGQECSLTGEFWSFLAGLDINNADDHRNLLTFDH